MKGRIGSRTEEKLNKRGDTILELFISFIFNIVGIFVCVLGFKMVLYLVPFGLVFLFFGVLIGYAGFAELKSYKALSERSRISKTGIRCVANVTAVCIDKTIVTGGQCRQYIECVVENPITGLYMSCTSVKVFKNLQSYGLETVPVYINTQNPDKYYVDIYEAIQQVEV